MRREATVIEVLRVDVMRVLAHVVEVTEQHFGTKVLGANGCQRNIDLAAFLRRAGAIHPLYHSVVQFVLEA